MVFENLTLFEIRLEDAQFGPRSLGGDAPDEGKVGDEPQGRARLAALIALTLVSAGLVVAWRRFRADVDDELGAAYDEGKADLAAAQ